VDARVVAGGARAPPLAGVDDEQQRDEHSRASRRKGRGVGWFA
jgi:hypothetical protein